MGEILQQILEEEDMKENRILDLLVDRGSQDHTEQLHKEVHEVIAQLLVKGTGHVRSQKLASTMSQKVRLTRYFQ